MKISHSEQYVQQLFQAQFRIELIKIDEQDGKEGQTPDFECIRDGRRIFVCELKEFEMTLPSEDRGWVLKHHPDSSIEATRKSNALNRVGTNIYGAYKQLKKYPEPKVLVFLNHEGSLDVSDLEEAFKGFFTLLVEDDVTYVNTYARRVSEGRIKDIKRGIDLYIWIDVASTQDLTQQQDKVYFRGTTKTGRRIAQEYFGVSAQAA